MTGSYGSRVSRTRRTTGGASPLAAWAAAAALLLTAAAAPAAPPVVVEAADPPAAEQATVDLDVTISGRGFDAGSQASFLVTGTADPGGVTVKSTTFVSSKRLVARIDVAADATVGDFDIEVLTTSGRRGKGTETFAVLQQGSGNPDNIVIHGTLRDAAGDDVVPDTNAPYEDVMPDTGNLVFQLAENGGRSFSILLTDAPEAIENPCDDDPGDVCLRDGSTPVAASYDAFFLAINMLGESCDGTPNPVAPRDMFAGECIRTYLSISFDHPGTKPRVQMRLRCGKEPNEGGDPLRLECLDNLDGACIRWVARPFLDGGGAEHMTCQLYHRARKGNETNLELAEYDVGFGITVDRQ